MAMSTVTHFIINISDVKTTNLNHSTQTAKSVYFQSETLNHLTQFATATFNKRDIVEEHSHQTMNKDFGYSRIGGHLLRLMSRTRPQLNKPWFNGVNRLLLLDDSSIFIVGNATFFLGFWGY